MLSLLIEVSVPSCPTTPQFTNDIKSLIGVRTHLKGENWTKFARARIAAVSSFLTPFL
jgi:hypothetical protein